MTARRSSSDPVSRYLATGERVVWRHQPAARTLFWNRLPTFIVVSLFVLFGSWITAHFLSGAIGGTRVQQADAWLIMPWAFVLFSVILLAAFLRFAWQHLAALLDSWSTHYALTDRRFMIVSRRGLIEYDASYFTKMEAVDGERGRQILRFDYGPFGKQRRDAFRDRITALPDAKKLEHLIRQTLRA
jgi:hypothetical protein